MSAIGFRGGLTLPFVCAKKMTVALGGDGLAGITVLRDGGAWRVRWCRSGKLRTWERVGARSWPWMCTI